MSTIAVIRTKLKGDKSSKSKNHKEETAAESYSQAPSDNEDGGVVLQDTADAEQTPSKKRKRDAKPVEELEIDVSAPEPPSKKALRKAKKAKTTGTDSEEGAPAKADAGKDPEKRSDHGVWIGNLPWAADKAALRQWLVRNGGIGEEDITRVHMPVPADAASSKQRLKPQNKGFAYVDFNTAACVDIAVALSEKLMTGRRLLIKNAKSFEGRPEKPAATEGAVTVALPGSKKPPNKRVFLGNLGFDVTKEDIQTLYERCGPVANIHMATFEDTGKCKGYAWITFEDLEAAIAAVRGYTFLSAEDAEEKSEEEDAEMAGGEETSGKPSKKKKAAKPRKWWVNQLKGRSIRSEFAEDAATRYKKRFGKEGTKNRQNGGADGEDIDDTGAEDITVSTSRPSGKPSRGKWSAADSQKKVDARTIKPGAALSNAPRQTAAIVESTGKRKTFED